MTALEPTVPVPRCNGLLCLRLASQPAFPTRTSLRLSVNLPLSSQPGLASHWPGLIACLLPRLACLSDIPGLRHRLRLSSLPWAKPNLGRVAAVTPEPGRQRCPPSFSQSIVDSILEVISSPRFPHIPAPLSLSLPGSEYRGLFKFLCWSHRSVSARVI